MQTECVPTKSTVFIVSELSSIEIYLILFFIYLLCFKTTIFKRKLSKDKIVVLKHIFLFE